MLPKTDSLNRLLRLAYYSLLCPALLRKGLPKPRTIAALNPEDLLSRARRIVVFRLDHIGDVVNTTPFLRELRKSCPAARITLVTRPLTLSLVENCPYVNEVLTLDLNTVDFWGKFFLWPRNVWRAFRLVRRSLRRQDFDLALIPRSDADYYYAVIMACKSRIPVRVGYTEGTYPWKKIHNPGFDRLLTHVVPAPPVTHEVLKGLHLLQAAGGRVEKTDLELWMTDRERAVWQRIARQHRVREGDLLVAIGIGSRGPEMSWPTDRFIALGRWLSQTYSARLVIIGGTMDRKKAHEIQSALAPETIINLTGKLSVRESAFALGQCRLFIGNDTGPKHLAAATGVPTIEISSIPRDSGSIRPDWYAAWGAPTQILQPDTGISPCRANCRQKSPHCITRVSLPDVQNSVREFLDHPAFPWQVEKNLVNLDSNY